MRMSATSNPEYNPDWEATWLAAKKRFDTVGGDENSRDMWNQLDRRFETLEEYHAALLDRLRENCDNQAHTTSELFPFDALLTPEAMRAKFAEARYVMERCEWETMVKSHKRYGQPPTLSAFATPLRSGAELRIERLKWGGLWGRTSSPSEALAVSELSADEAHVCFLSPAIRGTHPSLSDDHEGYVQLPTAYYREVLADLYRPDQVTWYHYHSSDNFEHNRANLSSDSDFWQFRRARLAWEPTQQSRFLWIQREYLADFFYRPESWSNDYHYTSVPRVIGEAVLRYDDATVPIVELADAHLFPHPSWQTRW